jgi:hypothetical protein
MPSADWSAIATARVNIDGSDSNLADILKMHDYLCCEQVIPFGI